MDSTPGASAPALRRRFPALRAALPVALALLASLALAARAPAAPLAPAPMPVMPAQHAGGGAVHGTLHVWGEVIVDFTGPATSEQGLPNPFLDYRLDVLFRHEATGQIRTVPGYYAADGNAAETSAASGGIWRVHLLPHLPGSWTYKASFRTGTDVAVSAQPKAGTPTSFNGAAGSFTVAETPAGAPGFLAHGLLQWDGRRYAHFAGSGLPFIKTGANSPENLLAFAGFDGTPASHQYASHVADWTAGDPTWKSGLGKGLIGALNYLAGRGVNSAYFLTFNVGGDGDDVWPWTDAAERLRFDVSKLDQWDIAFAHMDRKGIALHVVTQETENDNGGAGLDGGQLGTERKLYYRELVARFGHHLALQWNLGEENSNTTAQLEAFIGYVRGIDPYDHPIALHTFPTAKETVFPPLLAAEVLEAASLQVLDAQNAHAETLEWITDSAAAGRPWIVTVDEIGPPSNGVVPDSADPTHDVVRQKVLWGNLMAGGAGCEWYFGYAWPNDDLDCEDLRSREQMWKYARLAREFVTQYLPLDAMASADALVSAVAVGAGGPGAPVPAWCLAQPGAIYAAYLPDGGVPSLNLGTSGGAFTVQWYDPRAGGALQAGSLASVTGPGVVSLGQPPSAVNDDWAVLVRPAPNSPPAVSSIGISPVPFPGNAALHIVVSTQDPDGVADVQSVVLHVFTPSLQYVGAAPAVPGSAAGQFELHVPSVPALTPGKWVIVAVATDAASLAGLGFKTFMAQ